MELDLSIEKFRNYLENLKNKRTADTYYFLLKSLEEWLMKEHGLLLDDLTPSLLDEYLVKACNSPHTSRTTYYAVRSYWRWKVMKKAEADMDYSYEDKFLKLLMSINPPKVPRIIKKQALTPEEVMKLLSLVKDDYEASVATVVFFYFGWRPVEAIVHLRGADIRWEENYMIIKTAKTGSDRILVWDDSITPFIKAWYDITLKILHEWHSQPWTWYTKKMKNYNVGGVHVTAKTARKTFETNMRMKGIEQWAIDFILGHTTKVPDIYTDWTRLIPFIRDVMCNRHYLKGYLF